MSDEVEVQDQQAESVPPSGIETEQAAASAAAETSETQSEQSTGDEQTPKKEGGIQRKFNELTKARRLAELDAEYWKAKALGGPEPAKPAPAAADSQPKPKPKQEDFETTEAYLDARDEWVRDDTLRVAREERQKAEQARTAAEQAEDRNAEWVEREAAFKEAHSDYEEVCSIKAVEAAFDGAQGPSRKAIAFAIQEHDLAPALLYHLCKNPDELRKLTAIQNPTVAVMRLGVLAERLAPDNAGGEKEPPPISQAPKPPTPTRKGKGTDDGELRDDLSPEEWKRRYLKKLENS